MKECFHDVVVVPSNKVEGHFPESNPAAPRGVEAIQNYVDIVAAARQCFRHTKKAQAAHTSHFEVRTGSVDIDTCNPNRLRSFGHHIAAVTAISVSVSSHSVSDRMLGVQVSSVVGGRSCGRELTSRICSARK